MNVHHTGLPGVLLIEPSIFADARGFFLESYHAERYAKAGLPERFVQDNHSSSTRGTIRGLHYQLQYPQGKLLRVLAGEIYDVAVDIRRGSPTFGKWWPVTLSAENRLQVFVPVGFAHGFCVVSEAAEVEYKCTDYYAPDDQHGIRWNDPTLRIPWPVADGAAVLSDKDRNYGVLSPSRSDLPDFAL